MAGEFKYLLSPIKIGKKTAKNRIACPAHYMLYGGGLSGQNPYSLHAELSDDRYVAYLEEKAKGGAAVIVTRTCEVGPENIGYFDYTAPNKKRLGESCRKIAAACQKHGALTLLQLGSYGKEQGDIVGKFPRASWGFSGAPSVMNMEKPYVLETHEIEKHIAEYADFAKVAKDAGMDGIELHASEGSIIHQSLYPGEMMRDDKYGKHLAFVTDLINSIRAVIGPEMILSIRLVADDMWPKEMGGLGNEGLVDIARKIDQLGKVDMFVTAHGHGLADIHMNIQPFYMPLGLYAPMDAQIKQAVKNIVVVANGRIKDPAQAEQLLADGAADMVGLTRAHIADPHWAKKVAEGKADDIRPCIACNQGCVHRICISQPATCLQNPSTGREHEFKGTIEPCLDRAKERKKVVVVGGGPGGMEAARVAAERGHDVILYEKTKELGGQINIVTKVHTHSEFIDIVRWRKTQIDKLKVKVRLGVEATPEMILAENADVVVIATGSNPNPPALMGSGNVISCAEAILGSQPIGENVAVLDLEWRFKAVTAAEHLAEMGKKVKIVTPTPMVAMLSGLTRTLWSRPLMANMGVTWAVDTHPVAFEDNILTAVNTLTQQPFNIEGIDTVVYATYNEQENRLYKALKGKVKRLELIGDAWAPRTSMHAIHDAFYLCREL